MSRRQQIVGLAILLFVLLLTQSVLVAEVLPNSHHLGEGSSQSVGTIMKYAGTLTNSFQVTVNFTRRIEISRYLYVGFTDRISVVNHGDTPFGSLIVFYRPETLEKLRDLKIFGGYNATEELDYTIGSVYYGSYIGVKIALGSWVTKGQEYVIEIRARVEGCLMYYYESSTGDILYNFTFPEFLPKTLVNVSDFRFEVTYPDDGTVLIEDVEPSEGRTHDTANKEIRWSVGEVASVDKLNETEQVVKVPFRKTSPPINILTVEKNVYLRPTGNIYVKEHYVLSIFSPAEQRKFEDITIGLGKDAQNVKAWDSFGNLKVSTWRDSLNITFARVSFRTELSGNTITEFWVSYELLANSSSVVENKTGFYITIPLAPLLNATIQQYTLRIYTMYIVQIYPEKVKLSVEGYKPAYYGIVVYQVLVYSKSLFSPLDNAEITIRPLPSPNPYLRLFFALLVPYVALAILSGYLANLIGQMRRRKKVEELPEIIALREKLEDYMKLLEEYVAMEEEFYTFLYERVRTRPTIRMLEVLRGKLQNLQRLERQIRKPPEEITRVPEIKLSLEKITKYQAEIDVARTRILEHMEAFLRGAMPKRRMYAENESYLALLDNRLSRIKREISRIKEIAITKYAI